MGLVIGKEKDSWLVLWTTGEFCNKFQWHLADALQVIDHSNISSVASRGGPQP